MNSGVIVNIESKHYYCEYLLYRMSYMEHHRFEAEFVADTSISLQLLYKKQVTFTVTDTYGNSYRFGGVVLSSSYVKRHGSPYKIRIEGGAPTLLMDIEKGNDSYIDITLRGLINNILFNYRDVVKYKLQGVESIIRMFEERVDYRARYMETEWSFLMRLLKDNGIPVWYSGEELVIGSSSNGSKSKELSLTDDFLYYEPVYTDTRLEKCLMGLHNPVLGIGDSLLVEGKEGLLPKLRVVAAAITFKERVCETLYEAIPSKGADKNLYDAGRVYFAGFQKGTVIRNDDPKSLGRVMVQLHWHKAVDITKSTNWIDVLRPDAGLYSGGACNRGFFFIPEVGDSVVVSYFENDMNRPVVCSPLYADGAAQWEESDNCIKSFSTRSGHRIVFDDSENGGIEISDKAGNILKMESKSGSITLSAPQKITVLAKEIELFGNKICEIGSESLLKLKCDKDVSIASTGETEISSYSGVTLFAENNLSVECNGELNIEHNADGRWCGKGKIDIKSGARVNIAKML